MFDGEFILLYSIYDALDRYSVSPMLFHLTLILQLPQSIYCYEDENEKPQNYKHILKLTTPTG